MIEVRDYITTTGASANYSKQPLSRGFGVQEVSASWSYASNTTTVEEDEAEAVRGFRALTLRALERHWDDDFDVD